MDFHRLFESSPAAILALDATEPFRIGAVTDAYLAATKTRRDEIVGRGIFDVFPDNPEEPRATGVRNLRESLRRVARQGVVDTMALQRYDIPCGGGRFEKRWWSPTNAPVFDGAGRLCHILHRVEDVTAYVCESQESDEHERGLRQRLEAMEAEIFQRAREIHETNSRLEAANARLAGESARKTEFLTVLAHELRTPFTALALRLQGVKRQLSAPQAKPAEGLEKALDQTRRLKQFIDDLLEYAEVSSGKRHEKREPIDLEPFVRKIAEEITLERPQAVTIEGPPRPVIGLWDPSRLEHIVANVVENAVKFGNGQPIEVRIEDAGAKGVIHVQDHGIGIMPEKVGAIFDRFYRAAPVDSYPGLGLGLSIAAEFAASQGGAISAASVPGNGSTFTITLPLE